MSQTAIIGVAVLMMCCCSSSVGAFFLMGDGDGTTGPTGPTGPGPKTYVYDFIVNIPHHSTIGHHINDVLVDGVKPPVGSVSLYAPPDRNDDTLESHIWDGDQGTMAAYNDRQSAGSKFMTITLKSRPTKFTIRFGRPLYAPGWIIKENGVQIIQETANRGSEQTPSPIEYDYILP
jgi:hypothetical protein